MMNVLRRRFSWTPADLKSIMVEDTEKKKSTAQPSSGSEAKDGLIEQKTKERAAASSQNDGIYNTDQ